VDGNFKLDNLKMKKAEDDVGLSDGDTFFVGDVQYKEHLKQIVEPKEVSTSIYHSKTQTKWSARNRNAQITVLCHRLMPGVVNTWRQVELAQQHARATDASTHIALWIFRRVKGMSTAFEIGIYILNQSKDT
jgi:hypothetical protein